MFNFFKKSIKKEIAELSDQILSEISLNEKVSLNIDSCGITDGKEIISEFLMQNETGLAYEHLIYVISECEFNPQDCDTEKINSIAKRLGIKPK